MAKAGTRYKRAWWNIPAGGTLNANSQAITNLSHSTANATAGWGSAVDNSYIYLRGATNNVGFGAWLVVTGKSYGNPGRFEIYTPDAAATADIVRLIISGVAATAVATWSAVTHTGLVITSAGLVEGAGTGANGFVIKNPKNAAASALSGTQLDVEINIGGTPYHFTVYPTKA